MKAKDGGFTLLELVIVMTLMVLMLGLVGMHFANHLPSVRLSAAGRELSGLIRMARIEAMNKADGQTVTVDLDGRTFAMDGRVRRVIPEGISITIIDPVAGSLSRGKYGITADASGSVEACEIILNNAKRKLRIEIDPIVGSVVMKSES
ncbi:MAG TPA: prepilin-type N-terminal cleavage/methylation domain-containing protein [Syntrophorhabdaceae bacterium]|nr:prepilin-type N-terminal cleavage/methylation domain-containing protein [Syntrophorhabdaceae bacterium]